MSTEASLAENARRTAGRRRPPEREKPTSAREIFPAWNSITEEVMRQFVAANSADQGEGGVAHSKTAFFRLVADAVNQHPEWGVSPSQVERLVAMLRDLFFGLGPLAPYFDIPGLEEILCNRWDRVFLIVHGQKQEITPSPFSSEADLVNFLSRLFAAQNRELNLGNPAADGHLPDGSRIHADVPPHSVNGACFAIRKFNPRAFTMEDYLNTGMFTEEYLSDLRAWIDGQLTILVAGGTASGKTSFLNAIGNLIPKDDRIVVIEDTKELRIELDDILYLQSVNTGSKNRRDSKGNSLGIREGVRNALRLRPDRIIVGEVRGHEAFDLLEALNTGHDGSFATIHANSAIDAVGRLESLAMSAGELPVDSIRDRIASTIDLVIQIGRFRGTPYRKVLETWQVIHPRQIPEESRPLLQEAARRGDMRKLNENTLMLRLYTLDQDGVLTRHGGVVPIIGKYRAIETSDA